MLKKLKKLVKSRGFIAFVGCFPLIVLVLVICMYSFGFEILMQLYAFFKLHGLAIIAIIGLLVGFYVSLMYFLPVVLFPLAKIRSYLSLWGFCKRHRYEFKTLRPPFASLKGLECKGDIEIVANGVTYCIHFIDIIYRYSRAITFIDGKRYVLTKTYSLGSSILGSVMGNIFADKDSLNFNPEKKKYLLEYDRDKTKPIPNFSGDANRQHIVMLASVPADARLIDKKSNETLYGGADLEGAKFYYVSSFKRRLMR